MLRAEVEKLKQKRAQGFKPNQSSAQSTPPPNCEETGSHRNGGREVSHQPD
jgi:hypothetical protein